MIKTEMQVERECYYFVKNSDLGKAIRGTGYRSDMPPANATTEDLIIKFLAGLDEQVQSGVVIFNLYVPDIPHSDGRKVPDKKRIGRLQELILAFVENAGDTEYWLQTDTTPTTMKNEDIEQHFIYARIKFNRITE